MTAKSFLRWFLSIFVAITLLGGTLSSAQAQTPVPGDDIVSFTTLGQQDNVLYGPLDSHEILLRLPADWSMTAGSILHVNLNAATGMSSNPSAGIVGFFDVYLNDIWLTTVNLATDGEYSVDIPLPQEAWITNKTGAIQNLRFELADALRCEMWLAAATNGGYVRGLSAVLRASSYINFSHETRPVSTDLAMFPYPMYQNTFKPDQAVLVLPDKPTQGEMQAAMTVSSAFGRLTNRKFELQLLAASQVSEAQLVDSHLVFIGAASSFPQLTGVNLPASFSGGSFGSIKMTEADGILQMIVSPTNPAKAWLLVSGKSDAAIIKAAQALGSGQMQPYGPENLVVITETGVNNSPAGRTDFTFADLGYPLEQTYYGFYNDLGIWFDMPANQAADGAYFEMVFTNSAVLNYDESNVKVMVNDNMVGGLRFSDRTASSTRWKFNIPASFLHPGRNLLLLEIFMSTPSPCIPLDELWFSIMPESLLHLPTTETPAAVSGDFGLANYPYMTFSSFDQTAFIVPKGDAHAWSLASKLALDLGRKLGGSSTNIDTYYADAVPEEILKSKDLILVGRPSAMPVLEQLSGVMPAPFAKGSNLASDKTGQYSFAVTEDVTVGYIQVFSSPWDAELNVLAVLGNKDEGLQAAATALLTPAVQKQMTGNSIVVLKDKIIVQKIEAAETTEASAQVVIPVTQESGNDGQGGNPGKINVSLPVVVMIVAVVLVVIGLLVLFVRKKEDRPGPSK